MTYLRNYTVKNIFDEIDSAIDMGFNVGVDTSGSKFGLAGSHAYHIIGTY